MVMERPFVFAQNPAYTKNCTCGHPTNQHAPSSSKAKPTWKRRCYHMGCPCANYEYEGEQA